MKAALLKWMMTLAPAWFGLVIVLVGASTPGYKPASQAISELGAPGAPYAWLVNWGGFIPVGCALLAFARAAGRFWDSPRPKTLATVLLGLTGVAVLVAGLFPTDPGGWRNTPAGMIHAVAGITLLVLISLTPLVAACPTRNQRLRAVFRIYSWLTGAVLVGLFFLTPNGLIPWLINLHRVILGAMFPVWYKFHGVHQRIFMGIYFVWLALFAQLNLDDRRPDRFSNNDGRPSL